MPVCNPSRVAGGRSRVGSGERSAFDQSLETLPAIAKNASPQTGRRRFGSEGKLRERFNLFAQGGGRSSLLLPVSATKLLTRRQFAGDAGNKVTMWRNEQTELLIWFRWVSSRPRATHWKVTPLRQGNQQILRALQDPNRRPAVIRSPLPPAILNQVPEVEFDLSQEVCGLHDGELLGDPQA